MCPKAGISPCSRIKITDSARALDIRVVYTFRVSKPGKEVATLPFTPALSAPADDASFLRGMLEAIPAFALRLDHEQRIRYVHRVRPHTIAARPPRYEGYGYGTAMVSAETS